MTGLCKHHLEALFKDKNLKAYTGKTITDLNHLMLEIELVRLRGWAEDDEEYEEGVRCIAAPIQDYSNRVIASVSTSGPTTLIAKHDAERIAGYVVDAAAEISKRMGYCSTDRCVETVI